MFIPKQEGFNGSPVSGTVAPSTLMMVSQRKEVKDMSSIYKANLFAVEWRNVCIKLNPNSRQVYEPQELYCSCCNRYKDIQQFNTLGFCKTCEKGGRMGAFLKGAEKISAKHGEPHGKQCKKDKAL